ncbi:hypothetical protein PC116_g8631 [Phytophthora cactorum]|uniref:Uncharacterized protein n=1 Tax=Phytophthora cactorum TaxID=29920 RepID=A0A8T1E709_9STRA|nr:hypothetical protein Pcac1_g3527 [Phytophthora cactorum]KAG2920643.1 hypothetical protein PC114_g6032 [Phytophthora cactorum]KAG2948909.1 hypothetical protein PC117_g5675 [Phytophthora cactorum]KAG3031712.1 hypothetical protein PC120_g2939 [Phytophthora cactorum]KAG3032987.1 hypothetical protein PC119_g5476 [Phytophthora cactorum]
MTRRWMPRVVDRGMSLVSPACSPQDRSLVAALACEPSRNLAAETKNGSDRIHLRKRE